MKYPRVMLSFMVVVGLLAGCTTNALLTGIGGDQPSKTTARSGLQGRLLDLNGSPAADVPVTGYLIANNTASLVSNNAAGLVSNNTASYRVQAGSRVEARTDKDGLFVLKDVTGNYVNIEAALSDDLKAIRIDVASTSSGVELKLAYTGKIRGRVKSSNPQVTDLLGVDVFIPGTGYVAKSDAQGNYEIPHVPTGRFFVVALHPDLGRGHAEAVTVTSKTTVQAPEIALNTMIPRIAALAPDNGAAGQAVTITGEDFGVSIGKQPEVLFNGVHAQVVAKSDTTLEALVPIGALNGQVTVKVAGLNSNQKPFKVIKDLAIFPVAQASLALTPEALPGASDVLAIDQPRRYLARALDTEGTVVASPSIAWSTSAPSVGTVDAVGMLTGAGVGTLDLKLRSGSRSATLSVEIVGAVSRLEVTPAPVPALVSYPVGATPDLTKSQRALGALTFFGLGGSRALPVTWSTTDPRISLSAGGVVSTKPGAEAGTASVTVQSIADPRRSLQVQVPVVRQGSLAIEIE